MAIRGDHHPPSTMRAVRLHPPGGLDGLRVEQVRTPEPQSGEVLIRVEAAAITRDELGWSVDRLPAIPSYELSGVVAGERVYALAAFDRDGAAAEYIALPAGLVAPAPRSLDHVESAAVPLAGLSAWHGLFDHGGLEPGQRVLIHGAAGGVGHFATQLARWRGARVIGTTSAGGGERASRLGAHEVRDSSSFEEGLDPVDLVFDTVGGSLLERSAAVLREGGRIVSVAEEPPAGLRADYFIVQPRRDQLLELARLIDEGHVRPAIDSVFRLADARAAFERSMAAGKAGKVVIRLAE